MALSQSQDICSLLLNKKDFTEEDTDNLIYTQIFPYLYVDDAQIEQKSYVCIEVDVPEIRTDAIKYMRITIWAYCYKDIMKYTKKGYVGTRADILADMVERTLRKYCNNLGIGNLQLTSVAWIKPQSKYYGKQLIFSASDFKYKG